MKLSVFSVDDDTVMLRILELVFRKRGLGDYLRVFTSAADCLSCLDSEHDEQTNFLILLDLNMPEMNGWDFLDALKDKPFKQNVSVVILTSSVAAEDRNKAKTYDSVVGYMEKPFKNSHVDELLSLKVFELSGIAESKHEHTKTKKDQLQPVYKFA